MIVTGLSSNRDGIVGQRRAIGPVIAAMLGPVLTFGAVSAHAQTPVPGGAPPSLPSAELPPQGSPLSGLVRPVAPAVAPSLKEAPAVAGTAAAGVTVLVSDSAVMGATAYKPASLQAMIAGLTGPAVPAQQIEAARTAILNRYRRDGFVYTTVNARIRDGRLVFLVTEGRIVDVKLDGKIGPAGTQVLRFLHHLTDQQPISVANLERWLLLAGDVPGVSLSAELNPSTEDPGALTLVAHVTRAAVTGQISADNRAFRQTGPEELLALADLNSFTSFGEKTEVSIFHTFNNTETFGQGAEEFFIGGSGLKLRVYGGIGKTTPSGDLRALGYDGTTRVGGLEFAYPLIRSRAQTLNLTMAGDLIESEIKLSANTDHTPVRSSFDSLRIFRAGVDYRLLDTWLGAAFPSADTASLRVSQGVHALGATPNHDKDAPRVGERTDFTKLSGQVDRTQTLFTPYRGGTVSLKAAAAGQFSRDIMPPAEKFYLGGAVFGRGFYYGQVTGDSGVETTVEPLLDTRLPTPRFSPYPLSAEFYSFYDWGESYSNQKDDQDHTLRSLGGGARLYLGERAELDVEGVSRLTRSPSGSGPGISRLKSSAVYWQVLARF